MKLSGFAICCWFRGRDVLDSPSLDLEAPGPSRVASSHIGSAEKGFAKPSHENIVGSSLGMVQEIIWMLLLWMVILMMNHRVSFKPIWFVKKLLSISCPMILSKVLKDKFEISLQRLITYNNFDIKILRKTFWLFQ